jgi:hypothetical protein
LSVVVLSEHPARKGQLKPRNKSSQESQDEERRIVGRSNTSIKIETMMIESLYTLVTQSTVFGSDRHIRLACIAVHDSFMDFSARRCGLDFLRVPGIISIQTRIREGNN